MDGNASTWSWWTPRSPGSRNQNADSDTDSEHRHQPARRYRGLAESTAYVVNPSTHRSVANPEATTSEHRITRQQSRANVQGSTSNTSNLIDMLVTQLQESDDRDFASASNVASDDMAALDLTSSNTTHPISSSIQPASSSTHGKSKILTSDDQTLDDLASAALTSSEPIDPEATISEHETEAPPPLTRNGYEHSVYHFNELFKKLQLRKDFYKQFHTFINEHQEHEDVKAALMARTEEGIKEVARTFMEEYGKRVWKLKGKNCQQDTKAYRGHLFDINKGADRIAPIVEELWTRVRDLLYFDEAAVAAREAARAAAPAPALPLLPVGPWTQYGNRDDPNLRPGPLPAEVPSQGAEPEEGWEQTPEELAIINRFVNKVKAERAGAGRRRGGRS